MVTARKDPWTLVMAKCYDAAAEEYAHSYANGGGTFALGGRAKALLFAGRPADALGLFREVIEKTEPKLRGDSEFIDAGICHWYLRQPDNAVSTWREGITAPYTSHHLD